MVDEQRGEAGTAAVQKVLDALSSPIRREILWRIWEEELPAGAIAASFRRSAPTISEHLAVLRDAGLVTLRREGTRRYYRAVRTEWSRLQAQLADEGTKWVPADDVPEREHAMSRTVPAVVAWVEVPVPPATAFLAFTDPVVYSSWLGVPVSLEQGRFSCTLEWGTEVRGRYEHLVPDSLIAMRWDFDDDRVPLPGAGLVAYLRVEAVAGGSRVEVQQLVHTPDQAAFMDSAWRFVLGRLEQGLPRALDSSERPAAARAARPKRRQA